MAESRPEGVWSAKPETPSSGKERLFEVNIQGQIEALEGLAKVDAELKEVGDQLNTEREALQGKRKQLADLEERLARHVQSLEEMERTRGELVGEVRQVSLQVEKSREKLSRCRTEREANAAQRELEELRKIFRDREIDIEKIVGLVTQARGEIERLGSERAGVQGELSASEGDVTSRLGQLEKQVGELSEQRKQVVSQVQAQLYRRYELVRKRKGTAIASTHDGKCNACHMTLPPMLFQQLMRAVDFGQCPSCNRILYFRPEPTAADSPPEGLEFVRRQ